MSESYGQYERAENIRQLADQARFELRSIIPGSTFARMCMKFDFDVCEAASERAASYHATSSDEHRLQLEETLRLLAYTPPADPTRHFELALCWLDAKGYGTMPVTELQAALDRVRSIQ
ncbi:MAG TPA: hypothetical protein VH186_33675 [Chloroflexia bacterium]|nr:hypothetical protein [Chloroflexia bacterium]